MSTGDSLADTVLKRYISTVFQCDTTQDARYIRCDFKRCSQHDLNSQGGKFPTDYWMLNTEKNVKILEKHVSDEVYKFINSLEADEDELNSATNCPWSKDKYESNTHYINGDIPFQGYKKLLVVFNLRDPQSSLGKWVDSFLAAVKNEDDIKVNYLCITLSFSSRKELIKQVCKLRALTCKVNNLEIVIVLSCHSSSQGQVFSCTPASISRLYQFEEFCSIHDFVCACQFVLKHKLKWIHFSSCFTMKLNVSHKKWPVECSWYKKKLRCLLSGSAKEVYETGSQTADLFLLLNTMLAERDVSTQFHTIFQDASLNLFPDLILEMGLTVVDPHTVTAMMENSERDENVTKPQVVDSSIHLVIIYSKDNYTGTLKEGLMYNLKNRNSSDVRSNLTEINITCEGNPLAQLLNAFNDLISVSKKIFFLVLGHFMDIVPFMQAISLCQQKSVFDVYGIHMNRLKENDVIYLERHCGRLNLTVTGFVEKPDMTGKYLSPVFLYIVHLSLGENGNVVTSNSTSCWLLEDVYHEVSHVLSGLCEKSNIILISKSKSNVSQVDSTSSDKGNLHKLSFESRNVPANQSDPREVNAEDVFQGTSQSQMSCEKMEFPDPSVLCKSTCQSNHVKKCFLSVENNISSTDSYGHTSPLQSKQNLLNDSSDLQNAEDLNKSDFDNSSNLLDIKGNSGLTCTEMSAGTKVVNDSLKYAPFEKSILDISGDSQGSSVEADSDGSARHARNANPALLEDSDDAQVDFNIHIYEPLKKMSLKYSHTVSKTTDEELVHKCTFKYHQKPKNNHNLKKPMKKASDKKSKNEVPVYKDSNEQSVSTDVAKHSHVLNHNDNANHIMDETSKEKQNLEKSTQNVKKDVRHENKCSTESKDIDKLFFHDHARKYNHTGKSTRNINKCKSKATKIKCEEDCIDQKNVYKPSNRDREGKVQVIKCEPSTLCEMRHQMEHSPVENERVLINYGSGDKNVFDIFSNETKDVPLMANVDEVLVYHFNLDLNVCFGERCIDGDILLFIKPTNENVASKEFQMCLDCTLIDIEDVHEINLPDDFQVHFHNKSSRWSINNRPLHCDLTKENPCKSCLLLQNYKSYLSTGLQYQTLSYAVYGWCIRIWKEGKDWPRCVYIKYRTKPAGPSLMWCTDDDGNPCVFTPGAYINNRSMMPCQEPPVAMSTWQASIKVPEGFIVLSSGDKVESKQLLLENEVDNKFFFEMALPLPSSTLAFAFGKFVRSSKTIPVLCSPNTNAVSVSLYASASKIQSFENEYLELSVKYLKSACAVLGKYPFTRVDLIIMPRSFACLGLESPNLTFLSQSVLCGDQSMSTRIAHEISHAWFGLLVGAEDWTEEWLSEGFATYIEDRILAHGQGMSEENFLEYSYLMQILRYKTLQAEIAVTEDDNLKRLRPIRSVNTKSVVEAVNDSILSNIDATPQAHIMIPNAAVSSKKWSQVHYLKGYFLLQRMANMVGLDSFDAFLRYYLEVFAGRLVTSEMFFNLYVEYYSLSPSIKEEILSQWMESTTVPIFQEGSPSYNSLVSSVEIESKFWKSSNSSNKRCRKSGFKRKFDTSKTRPTLNSNQLVLLLENVLNIGEVETRTLTQMNHVYNFGKRNSEVRHRWCELVIKHLCTHKYEDVRRFLIEDQGMGIYLFAELVITGNQKQLDLAINAFETIKHEMDRSTLTTVSEILYGADESSVV